MSPRQQSLGTIGHYEIQSLLGKGGMGVVYSAKDTRLGRMVALKLLSLEGEGDRRLGLRLQEEAKVISRLTHPNICALHDFGMDSGRLYLVMEYLEGETLADRIAKGPIPLKDCLRIGIEIAAALQHAHGEKILHRDLKPGNIMLTRHGAKLLDFGLAKLEEQQIPVTEETMELSAPGTILGTWPYMAPEQLRGKPGDARSDLYSFGVMLYEMSCGKRPFVAETAADMIAMVLHQGAAPLRSLRADFPAAWDRIVQRCLAKDPRDRWQSAADLREAMQMLAESEGVISGTPRAPLVQAPAETVAGRGWIYGVAAALVLAAASYWLGTKMPSKTEGAATAAGHFVISAPEPYSFAMATDSGGAAISPDGNTIVFVCAGETPARLWQRRVDQETATPLRGTEGGFAPFWSADSKSIGFFAGGFLKKIRVADEVVQKLTDAAQGRGGTWGPDGTILFTPADVGGTAEHSQAIVHRIAESGGTAAPLGKLDTSRGESGHVWPYFLPDGKHYLYVGRTSKFETQGLFVASLDGGQAPQLIRTVQSNAQFLPRRGTKQGHLVFFQDGSLMAQEYDTGSNRLLSEPKVLAEKLGYSAPMRSGFFGVSESGSLLYSSAQSETRNVSVLARDGSLIRTLPEASQYYSPRISRDGENLFVSRFQQTSTNADLWFGSLKKGDLTRFTFEDSHEASPIWSPDGTEVIYSVIENAIFQLMRRNIKSGSAPTPVIEKTSAAVRPYDWSKDGKLLIYAKTDARNLTDIWAVALHEGNRTYPILNSPANELHPQLSPDGRWLAYTSDVTGAYEVYVERLGNSRLKWQVSSNGGTMSRWRGDGKEIYFLNRKDELMAATVSATGESLVFGETQRLMSAPLASRQRMSYTYDAAADGKSFVLLTPVEYPEQKKMHLLFNWAGRLDRN